MCVTVVAIDLAYIDPERLSWTWFCCFVLLFTLMQHFQVNKYLSFSIGPGLIANWLNCFKTFTSIIFYYVGQMPSDVKWKKREKRNDKEIMKRQVFFIKLSIRTVFVSFYFWENAFFTFNVICSCSSSSETLRSNRSQMYFKISVLKNFSMFAKNTCVWVSF